MGNGLFMSRLIYGIQLWGGTEEYLLSMLQVLKNRAARVITGLGPYTPVKELMRQTGWLSVRQLTFYHSEVMVHGVRETGRPGYLADKIEGDYEYNTRAASTNSIRWGPQFRARTKLTMNSWRWRGVTGYNQLSSELKLNHDHRSFKEELRKWTSQNIDV